MTPPAPSATPAPHATRPPGLSPLGALVRRHDPDRFLAALFAPPDRREALFALYAFNHEVARVREAVSEPALGLIRLHWWREAVEEVAAGRPPRRHEVAGPLAGAIRRHALPLALFDRLLAGRERDLDAAGPADTAALLAYAEATGGALARLALHLLADGAPAPAAADAAGHAGTAFAVAGLLRAVPFHAGQRRLYLPADLLAAAGLPAERLFDHGPGKAAALAPAVAAVAAAARAEIDRARALGPAVPKPARAALLPAVLARVSLHRLARAGHDPFAPRSQAPAGPGRVLRLWWAAATGRV